MLCKELRKHLLDEVHPEAKAMFRDSLRGKVAKTYRTIIIEAYPVHFWWIKTQSFLESEPGPISAWDLSDGYKFPGFPCQPSSLPAHCGKSLTYIPMVPGWLPPANIITSACKVSILLRHPIPAHLNTVVRCTTSRRKWFSVIQPNSLTCWFQGHPRSTPFTFQSGRCLEALWVKWHPFSKPVTYFPTFLTLSLLCPSHFDI